MGANLDIEIYTSQPLPVSTIEATLQRYGIHMTVTSIETIDNWQYENFEEHAPNLSPSQLDRFVAAGKIVIASSDATYQDLRMRGGLQMNKESEHESVWRTALWVGIDALPGIIDDFADLPIEQIQVYELIARVIATLADQSILLIGGIGIETAWEYEGSASATMQKYGFACMVLPADVPVEQEVYNVLPAGNARIYLNKRCLHE